ncbi:transporter substrate-binding domain-containing protein [Exilibacterium tricleocarpae]|uniref:Transporter substrate-binding domain-containing protein n=1 Tax=Exilibacterium tricleocarpae TaxID=2591008 RepID=A0A545U8E7_9GAMM|nr:transporter substrate-binding domain-containing protein [Exilibacterium tricleocarpae]TQV85737.1 transporter substrate-binding domain-containing protein [Exilibacterium tricleocarpae]
MNTKLSLLQIGKLGVLLAAQLTVLLLTTGCSGDPPPAASPAETAAATIVAGPPPYIEQGDLDAIRQHDRLRLLVPRWDTDPALPRQGLPTEAYRQMTEEFAANLQLEVQWVTVDSLDALIPALLAGRGDIIVTNLTHTPARAERVDFTLPINQVREHIISAVDAAPIDRIEALNNKTVAVAAGSAYEESLQQLALENPTLDLQIVSLTDAADPDALLDRVNSGEFDATVLDHDIALSVSAYRNDFRVGTTISPPRNIAWAVRPNAGQLLAQLNLFITEILTLRDHQARFRDDLPGIKKRKTLRMITRNTPTNYFLWRGELMGFEYDLVKRFAKSQQLKLEVVVAPPEADMIDWLNQGRGDLIAASFTVTPARSRRDLTFTRPYNTVGEQLVTGSDRPALQTLDNLQGRTLVVRKNTAYWQTATTWLQQGHQFTLQAAPAHMNTDELLIGVANGSFDATLADSHLVAIEHRFVDGLQPGFVVQPERQHAWAVRKDNPELLAALNSYLKKHHRGLFFNVTYNKYFKNPKRIQKYQGQRLNRDGALSPYDDVVRAAARAYQLDWRLIVAQMYQESRFDPDAESFAGAQGLLQVMPRTARQMGYEVPFSVHSGIHAGVQYLNWVRDRFEAHLPLEERLWFTLAAYNAGYGHVYDARRLARQKGLDPDRWFDNVETTMLLLSKQEYASKARFGYVRGREPVNYVRGIRERYRAYLSL